MKELGEPKSEPAKKSDPSKRWEFKKLERLSEDWEGKVEKRLTEELDKARKRIKKAYEKKEK